MKNYDDLMELVKTVQASGILKTDEASVVEYQDMIGHSYVEQLEALANGDYHDAFYRVYGVAYGTLGAMEFYWKHGAKPKECRGKIEILECDKIELEDKVEELEKANALLWNDKTEALAEWRKTSDEKRELEVKLYEAENEIIRLKAKLFDYIEQA